MAGLDGKYAAELVSIMKSIDVVRTGEFTLKNGTKSPVYFDLRIISNHPKEFREITAIAARYLDEKALLFEFDAITAPPLAGIPLGVALAIELDKPFFLTRMKSKDHGTQKLVEGDVKGKRVLVVDDVITSGGSKTPILETLRNKGAIVNVLFVYVNRMADDASIRDFEKIHNVKLKYLLSVKDLSG
ncbi:MAG: orotate phosphoribosyltransferase [Candidatus Hodarchaeales archaeon]